MSKRSGLLTTLLVFENVSKDHLPWYRPVPLAPTPPKGRFEFVKWTIVSFTHTPPEVVPVKARNVFADGFQQLGLHLAVHEQVVGGYTSPARCEEVALRSDDVSHA